LLIQLFSPPLLRLAGSNEKKKENENEADSISLLQQLKASCEDKIEQVQSISNNIYFTKKRL